MDPFFGSPQGSGLLGPRAPALRRRELHGRRCVRLPGEDPQHGPRAAWATLKTHTYTCIYIYIYYVHICMYTYTYTYAYAGNTVDLTREEICIMCICTYIYTHVHVHGLCPCLGLCIYTCQHRPFLFGGAGTTCWFVSSPATPGNGGQYLRNMWKPR